MADHITLRGDVQRNFAKRRIDQAPANAVVTIKEAARSNDQNAKLWAMLGDISRAKPDGLEHTADMWKCLMMKACGHQVQFVNGIDGEPFPVGFRTSRLTVSQMCDLITCAQEYGDRHGVRWTDEQRGWAA